MKIICHDIKAITDCNAISDTENKYGFKLPLEVAEFFNLNNGGTPDDRYFVAEEEEFELRSFLSFNEGDLNSIYKPMEYFQKNTKGKIIPLGYDSFDNYFCMNLENGCIYFYDHEDELYYRIFDSFAELIAVLEN